jgi:hypothetical protein
MDEDTLDDETITFMRKLTLISIEVSAMHEEVYNKRLRGHQLALLERVFVAFVKDTFSTYEENTPKKIAHASDIENRAREAYHVYRSELKKEDVDWVQIHNITRVLEGDIARKIMTPKQVLTDDEEKISEIVTAVIKLAKKKRKYDKTMTDFRFLVLKLEHVLKRKETQPEYSSHSDEDLMEDFSSWEKRNK